MSDLYKLQDPTKQYPRPKFKKQTQAVPGLDKKMTPKADHGETSYRGSGRLPNRKALVTGGDSGIGRAAAIAFAREGADVAINYLPSEEADANEVIALIEAEGRKAFALPGDLKDEKFCVKLVKEAHKKLGGLDILACVAGRQHAVDKIADMTTKVFEETYRVNVFASVLDVQGGIAVDAGRVDRLLRRRRSRRRIPVRVCWIMLLRRLRFLRLRGHWRGRWRRMGFV